MRYNLRHLLLAITVLALAAQTSLPVFAQNPTGSIRGTVSDEQGAVIQRAAVTVTNKATGDARKTTTNEEGVYAAENLLPGEYDVKVEAPNFATQVLTLTVQVGNATNGNLSLRVGKSTEIVDVIATAPIIDKTNYKIDGVVSRQKIDALPLNGRNFLQLALLEPGVSVSVSNPGAANNLFNVSVGGSPSELTRITVDGGSVLDPVTGGAAQNFSTETIQEFQISTFNFDLSTGITSVGAVNIVSRTGTNQFHGNGFIFYRDHNIASFPTLEKGRNRDNPFFRREQYGGSFGGPIKKDRSFFFLNIERLDQTSSIGSSISGFSGFQFFNTNFSSPYTGLLANGRVDFKIREKNNLFVRFSHDDNNTFSPTATNSLPSNWRNNDNNDNNLQGGLTTLLRSNLVNDLRFNFQRITNTNKIPTAADCPPSNIGCIGLGGSEVFVNGSNLRFGNNDAAPQSRYLNRYQTTDNLAWQRGAHNVRFGGEWEHNYGHGTFAFADPAVLVLHDPRDVAAVNFGIANAPLPPALQAVLSIPLPASLKGPGLPIALSDILQLPIITAVVGFGDPQQPQPFHNSIARQSNRYRTYAQDSWLVRPGFTFSFGASYSYETNLQNHDLTKPALLGPVIGKLGKPGKDTNNIAPSFGFAWDVGNKGKTVVRGGAGIYYDTVLFLTRLGERALIGPAGNGRAQIFGAFFQNNVPPPPGLPPLPPPLSLLFPPLGAGINFRTIPTHITGQNFLNLLPGQLAFFGGALSAAGAAGFTGVDVFKTDPGGGALNILDPNLQVPYSEQFSIGFQHQLPHNMAISADFVARNRMHSLFTEDFNLFDRSAARGGSVLPHCTAQQAANPAAQCANGPIVVETSSGREHYKALLVKLDKRFSGRYQFTASYALSELKGFFYNADQTNWFGNSGDLDPDARHRFTLSGVVDLHRGFQASVIAVFASRPPFNAHLGSTVDLNGDGTFGDVLPGLKINSLGRGTSKKDLFILVNNFNQNVALPSGGAIKPVVLPNHFEFGDNFQSEDIRLTKMFKFKERYSVEFFGEVFNILNIANLGGFANQLDTGTFVTVGGQPVLVPPSSFSFGKPTFRAGQSFGTGGPRAFQFGGRFSF